MFAIDGTKVNVPWSDDNDRKLGNQTLSIQAKKRRRRRRRRSANSQAHLDLRPQILLTLAWHLGTGLSWSWKLGAVTDSERDHARQLLEELPLGSLLVMDAGFTGYEFWRDVRKAGHQFVVRVGSNVKLLKKLGWKVQVRGEFVSLWPHRVARRQEKPLVLRLLKFQGPKSTIFVATSVLSAHALSDRQLCEIYRQRWGIEGWFRSLKQTFGRRKMRSLIAEHALCELHWSIVGLSLIQLQGVEALVAAGESPQALSEAAAIRIVCSTVMHPDLTVSSLGTLRRRLQTAIVDSYQRSAPKAARHVHRKRKTNAPGKPNILNATKAQQQAARQLQALQRAA